MLRRCKIYLAASALMVVSPAIAQVTANSRMPPVIDLTRNGWDVSLQNGNLTFAIPLTTVPGEVPVPVAFGLNATFLAQSVAGPDTIFYYPDGRTRAIHTKMEIDRPVAGGIHFGYISTPITYGANGSADRPFSGYTTEGVTVIEDGSQIPDRDWTPFSAHAELGSALNLPQAYSFASVITSTAMVDPTSTYLTYSVDASGLGSFYQPIVTPILQAMASTGVGSTGTTCKVVLDKNRARVYAYSTPLASWLPVLWADRFNHYVTFQWSRITSGFPSGSPSTLAALSSVSVTNQRGQGVVLRWSEWQSADALNVRDILRLDYVGLDAPSLIVQGYPGLATNRPPGYTASLGNPKYTVVPSIFGGLCRPSSIQLGPNGAIAQPSWNSSNGPIKQVQPPPAGYIVSESPMRTWSFNYEPTYRSELTSCTDPRSVTTSFTWSNYTSVRGVSEADKTDTLGNTQSMRWTRNFGSPTTIKVEGWWDPNKDISQKTAPSRYHLYTLYSDALNSGNGVYQTDQLMDAVGKTWSNTTYTYDTVGAGLNALLSGVSSISVQQDGGPTITKSFGYVPGTTSKLQRVQDTTTATDAAGKVYSLSSTSSVYGARWDMLEGHQLKQTATLRNKPDGVTPLAWVDYSYTYDSPSAGPALLQLQQSYLDGTSTGKHGSNYTYDPHGRLNGKSVYHIEGTALQPSPKTETTTYDPASGVVSSVEVKDTSRTPNVSLIQSQGAFDSWGRPTNYTDSSGVMTTVSYDDRGRVMSKSRPGMPAVSYTYPDERTTKIKVDSNETTYSYDGFGRLISVSKPTGIDTSGIVTNTLQTLTYDALGRLVALQDTNPGNTSRAQIWTCDPLDRVTSQIPVVGNKTTTTYSVSGINRKVTTTLSNGVATSVLTNPFSQVVEVDSPDGSVTTAAYDQFGNRTALSINDGKGHIQSRSWNYDSLARLTSKTEPETKTQVFAAFNALNLATQIIEASGTSDVRARNLTYDGFGRTLSIVNGTDSLVNTYTGAKLTYSVRTVAGTAVSQSFTYGGPGGLVSSESTNSASTIGYGYDARGLLKTMTYPNNRTIGYSYDTLYRPVGVFQVNSYAYDAPSGVTTITQSGPSVVNSITYDNWGNRNLMTFASLTQDQWTTDTASGTRLQNWSASCFGGLPISKGYSYDDSTNLLTSTGDWALTNDPNSGRLIEADGFGIKISHSYDGFGNQITHTQTANPNQVPTAFNYFSFNPMIDNRVPTAEANGTSSTGWIINARGEATQVGFATASPIWLGITWDGLGLAKSIGGNYSMQTYTYAPSGMRLSSSDQLNGANSRGFAYTANGLLLSDYTSTGWRRDVIYLGRLAIAEIDANGVHELHSDHLGTPRMITNGANGSSEGTQDFGPFGELIQQSGPYFPITGFTGHMQADPLIYMRGRFYSPAWHRFINSDQGLDPSSINQYAYLGGRPMMGIDPSGFRADQGGDGSLWDDFWGWLFGSGGSGDGSGGSISGPYTYQPNGTVTYTDAKNNTVDIYLPNGTYNTVPLVGATVEVTPETQYDSSRKDYVSINFGAYLGLGASRALTIDKYGGMYWGGSRLGQASGLGGKGFTVTTGTITNGPTDSESLQNFLSGTSSSWQVNFGLAVGQTTSGGITAWEYGGGPGAGFSFSTSNTTYLGNPFAWFYGK